MQVTTIEHCDTLKQDNDSTVRGDGGSRVGEVRAGTTSTMPEHKDLKLHVKSSTDITDQFSEDESVLKAGEHDREGCT